jgi:hypothetical protein
MDRAGAGRAFWARRFKWNPRRLAKAMVFAIEV